VERLDRALETSPQRSKAVVTEVAAASAPID
jgi:hypothetical protein